MDANLASGSSTNHQLRDRLLDDYERKDSELDCFERTHKFSGVKSASDWQPFPTPHLSMNAVVIIYWVLGIKAVMLVFNTDTYGALRLCYLVWGFLVLLHAASHAIGVAVSGHSRESLVGESVFKAVLELVRGGLDHGANDGEKKRGARKGKLFAKEQ